MSESSSHLLLSDRSVVYSGCPADVVTNSPLIGTSVPIQRLRERIARVARSPLPILITGPTGTGKELVARALHQASRRAGKLVALNVAAIAGPMFEDAMFGHVRGAFTGALTAHLGHVSEAHRGSLFLDEIGTLGLAEQVKLLRVIETKSLRPVGGAADVVSDFRLVSATNADLDELVRMGQFRADLMYRVRGATITVPALCERLDDVPMLVEHFAHLASAHAGMLVRMLPAALRALQQHGWPGNVRELKNVVERLVYESVDGYVTASAVRELLAEHIASPPTIDCDDGTLRRELLEALEHGAWNVDQAAREFGMSRATMYRRMRELNLKRPRE